MKRILEGKVVVVTGGGSGIGRAEALACAAAGARVVVNDLGCQTDGSGVSESPADAVVEEIRRSGGTAAASYESVATWEGGRRIIQTACDAFGTVHVLVNNAGITRDAMIDQMTSEDWDEVIKVNLYGHFNCIRHALPVMKAQKYGRIINTSSRAGLGSVGHLSYAASKEGIVGLTRSVAQEVGPVGVTCNCIRPRAATRMSLRGGRPRQWHESAAAGRIEDVKERGPESVASLVVYLASEEAGGINGRTFLVYQGYVGLYRDPYPVQALWTAGDWTVESLRASLPQLFEPDKTGVP